MAIPLLSLLLLGQATEYESEVAALPPSFFKGGCSDVGHNPDPPDQAAAHESLTSKYSWSIITADAADRVARFIGEDGLIDFGAGSGYWSYLIANRGVDVVAIDDWSWGKPKQLWYPVQVGGFQSLAEHDERVLLLSWPPRNEMAIRALQAWNGTRLIYAGEILRRTADINFHAELAANWHLVERISIPQWRNRSDAIYLFEKREGAGDGPAWMAQILANCT